MGTFTARIEELKRMTGMPGDMTGRVIVDQLVRIYAHYQHEDLTLHHPRGGGPKYLERPLFDHYRDYLEDYAKTVLTDGGAPAMARSMEHLSDELKVYAPILFNHLRRSGHPIVTRDGATVYDREPEVHRLTEAQLRAQNRLLWPTYPGALKGFIYWNFTARGKAGLPPLGSGYAAYWRKRGRK